MLETLEIKPLETTAIDKHSNFICEQSSLVSLINENWDGGSAPVMVRLDSKASIGFLQQLFALKLPKDATVVITNIDEMYKNLSDKLRLKSERVMIDMFFGLQGICFRSIIVTYPDLDLIPAGIKSNYLAYKG